MNRQQLYTCMCLNILLYFVLYCYVQNQNTNNVLIVSIIELCIINELVILALPKKPRSKNTLTTCASQSERLIEPRYKVLSELKYYLDFALINKIGLLSVATTE